jgi:hypothetical protein
MSGRRDAQGAGVLTAVISLLPVLSLAAGSPSFARRIRSVHELIVQGERPEISACLYSAELAVTTSREFESIRWGRSISDDSVVRELSSPAGELVRVTRFEASALTRRTGLFARQRSVEVLVECRQENEKPPIVSLQVKPAEAN